MLLLTPLGLSGAAAGEEGEEGGGKTRARKAGGSVAAPRSTIDRSKLSTKKVDFQVSVIS